MSELAARSRLKNMARQYVEVFASEVWNAHKDNRPIDGRIEERIVNFVTSGLQRNEDMKPK